MASGEHEENTELDDGNGNGNGNGEVEDGIHTWSRYTIRNMSMP